MARIRHLNERANPLLSATYAAFDSTSRDRLKAASSSALRPFYASLADRAAAPLDILFVGDSIAEGEGTTAITNRWARRLIESIRSQFQPTGIKGGRGYVPAWYALANPAAAGFASAGSVTQSTTYGLGRRSATLAATGTLTITQECSSFDVVYAAQTGGGTFSVTVDGGAPTNIDTTGGGNLGGRTQRFTPSQRGSHTIVIAQVSGSPIVEGVMFYDGDETKGIRLWDGAHYGYTSGSFASNGTWSEGMLAFTADLAVVALGVNDFGTNVDPATYKTNVQTVITSIRAKSAGVPILLVGMYERVGSFTYTWQQYLDKLAEIAVSDSNTVVIDMTRRLPKGTTTDALGLVGADGVHPTDKGHLTIADQVSATLLDGLRGGVTLDGIVDANGNVYVGNTKGLILQRNTSAAGNNGKIFANASNQLDIQPPGGSLRVTNNAYSSINFEISDGGTITIRNGPQLRTGTGSPEGVVTAPVSSFYLRTDGGAGTCFYVKETGAGNTGWVAK